MPLVIAHRGASADAPENSLAAFRLAVAQGADGVETDLRVSGDGAIVLSHDDTLTRTHGVSLRVNDTPAATLASHGVPTLMAMLPLVRGRGLLINFELKEMVPPALLADTIGPDVDGIVFSSFHAEIAAQTRAALPHIPFAWLSVRGGAAAIREARRLGCVALHTWHRAATPRYCEQAAEAGLPLRVWTLDDPRRARTLAARDVAAIITNTPAHIKAAVSGQQGSG